MRTATDEREAPERHLLDRPQPLGILPTWWFWNQRENWRLVGWGFGLFAAVITITIPLLNLHPLMAGLVAAGALMMAIGLLEKYVRHQAERRRALAAAEAGETLGAAPLDSSED